MFQVLEPKEPLNLYSKSYKLLPWLFLPVLLQKARCVFLFTYYFQVHMFIQNKSGLSNITIYTLSVKRNLSLLQGDAH